MYASDLQEITMAKYWADTYASMHGKQITHLLQAEILILSSSIKALIFLSKPKRQARMSFSVDAYDCSNKWTAFYSSFGWDGVSEI